MLCVAVYKQHKENDTKIKDECEKMIHWYLVYSICNIDLIKEKCANAVAREHKIQEGEFSFANTKYMKECQCKKKKTYDARKKLSCDQKQSKAALQDERKVVLSGAQAFEYSSK